MGHYYSEMGDDPYGWEAQRRRQSKREDYLSLRLARGQATIKDLALVFETRSGSYVGQTDDKEIEEYLRREPPNEQNSRASPD
jgi:allantoicase